MMIPAQPRGPVFFRDALVNMSNALTVACTIGLGVYVIGMLALLQLQWHKLRCSDTDAALTAGLARTVMEFLTEAQEPAKVAALLERNRFRSIGCARSNRTGTSARQRGRARPRTSDPPSRPRDGELFKAILEVEGKGGVAGQIATGTLYRACDSSGSGDPQLTTFSSHAPQDELVVVATSCGHEG